MGVKSMQIGVVCEWTSMYVCRLVLVVSTRLGIRRWMWISMCSHVGMISVISMVMICSQHGYH